jgi:cathepsin A (carboxypeptidase C)
MKFQRLLPLAVLACTANVLAAPSSFFDDAQAVFSSGNVNTEALSGTASKYLSEAKKTILRGKKELETWWHDGREFVKQNNLLCESPSLFCCVRCC